MTGLVSQQTVDVRVDATKYILFARTRPASVVQRQREERDGARGITATIERQHYLPTWNEHRAACRDDVMRHRGLKVLLHRIALKLRAEVC